MKGNIIGYILLTVISFGVLPGVCQSNTFSLNGKVTDKESGLALEGISVYINNTTYSTQTDKDGSFRLAAIPLVNFELIFSAVNYETQTMRIDSAAARSFKYQAAEKHCNT
ncbi:carboxypeptidase-like regulatory domain-containing protein [Niabella defluvii]|nr:carboxypeptidase-like regulatory domain-containing protein [Niabella sp. I65]